MRRILVDNARRKQAQIHGGDRQRLTLSGAELISNASPEEIVALDESLFSLASEDSSAAEPVKLRMFAGLSMDQAARVPGISRATAYRHWSSAEARVMRSKPCRILLVVATLVRMVAQAAATAHADTMFWINDSGDSAGSPGVGVLNLRGGTGYIWGRPEGDETLLNLSLNGSDPKSCHTARA